MEKKAKWSNRPPVGRVRARREYTSKIVNPTIRSLINSYPAHFAVLWMQLFDEFGIHPITPSKMPSDRRYKLTTSMLRLMGYGLAEELEGIRATQIGRPAKVYRLVIPD